MKLRSGSAVFATALIALTAAAPAAKAAREPLNAYRVAPTAENKQKLALAGYDMTEADHGSYLEVYGTAKQASGADDAGARAQARRQGQPGRPRRPPTSRSAATRRTTSGAATTACPTTARSSTSSSMTGSRG